MFGTARQIITFLIFSVIFTTFFMALVYAIRWKTLLVERVEKTAREAQELRMAAEIQQALLPPRRRTGSSYEAAGASLPCRTIGGDFFEYFDFTSGRMGFALGDVAGKGPPAAILAAMVQGILTTHANEGPAATMTRVNDALCRRSIEGRFATMAYVVLDPGGTLTSCSAGHNPAVLLRANGAVERPDKGGLVLGAFETARYEEEAIMLGTGRYARPLQRRRDRRGSPGESSTERSGFSRPSRDRSGARRTISSSVSSRACGRSSRNSLRPTTSRCS
jgi:hypothetical protein